MKYIFRIIWAIILAVFFIFFLKNMQDVSLKFFLDYEIHSPLALLLFEFFVAGALLGVLGMASIVFRHRRDLSKHKKIISEMQQKNDMQKSAQVPTPDVTAIT